MSALLPAVGRDLTLPEIERLVDALAVRSDLWGPHVRHEQDERIYTQIHRDPHVDVWVICWSQQQETGLHDHDRSSGAVRVVQGALLEDRFVADEGSIRLETTRHAAGARFSFDATYIHDVRHDGGAPATSIHVYSPALWRMGHYALGERGLGRVSLTYVEEVAA